jgi:hypothetical protein
LPRNSDVERESRRAVPANKSALTAFAIATDELFTARHPFTFDRVEIAFRSFDRVNSEGNKFNLRPDFLCLQNRLFQLSFICQNIAHNSPLNFFIINNLVDIPILTLLTRKVKIFFDEIVLFFAQKKAAFRRLLSLET